MKPVSQFTVLEVMGDAALCGPAFGEAGTWAAWEAFLAALEALPMTPEQTACYRQHTGRMTPPVTPAREGWMIVGRRGGKSRVASLVAVYLGCFRDYRGILAPGETGTVMLLAADRRQARTLMRYVMGLLEGVPMLTAMIVGRTAESVTLSNRIVIEIHTSNFRAVRGYTVVAAICDEIAAWRSEDSANPDVEVLNGIRPGMATVPGAVLLCLSSPYARHGALWAAYQDHYGKDSDVLVWQADTKAMNPRVDEQVIAAASSGATWRTTSPRESSSRP
jgi:hypothetical protein